MVGGYGFRVFLTVLPGSGERTRTPGFQDKAVRGYGRGHPARFDHRVQFIRADHERHAIGL